MTTYLLLSAIVFFSLGISWTKKDFINFFVKLILICFGIAGFFYWLTASGYIIKH